MAANETQYTSNNNNKELEVEWWDSNGWATMDGVNSLEECSRQRVQTENSKDKLIKTWDRKNSTSGGSESSQIKSER